VSEINPLPASTTNHEVNMRSLLPGDSLVFAVALSILAVTVTAHGQTTNAKWESRRSDNGTRYLTYSASTTLLGKVSPFSVSFFCDPAPSKNGVHGAIGFDVQIRGVARLKPFNFNDFEGPDATTGKLMLVTVNRKGKPVLMLKLAPNGATPQEGDFVFGIADESRAALSDAKTVLKAIADNGESIQIAIADSRNPKLKLEFDVPVSDRQSEFKALLLGLR
jgi:hypothetical protein